MNMLINIVASLALTALAFLLIILIMLLAKFIVILITPNQNKDTK